MAPSSPGGLLSVFRFGTVPIGSDEERAMLQLRIAQLGKLLFVLGAMSFVLVPIASLVFLQDWPARGAKGGWVLHLIFCAVAAAVWLFCRSGTRSLDQLYAIDALVTVFLGGELSSLFLLVPGEAQPELIVILAVTYILIGRAALIPSTPRRTFVLSTITVLPVVLAGSLAAARTPGSTPREVGMDSFNIACFCVTSVIATMTTSRVVYGLTETMREVIRLGQYTLEEKLGEGGMGVVYKARHAMLRRPTAVKLILPGKAGPHSIARFEREVQLTSRLTHPNTIAIYDYGRTPDGVFYYAMEYLEGMTLEDIVRRFGPMPPGRVIRVLAQAAGALGEAHEMGIVHRDVKPANIILCQRGLVPDVTKVVDFGLVKDVGAGGGGDVALSNVNSIAGTPLYLSPEAIRAPDEVTARSDLYALGAVGYYLLTGAHAFDAPTLVEVCSLHLHGRPPPMAERLGRAVPGDLEAVLLGCMEKEPSKRPASADALQEALLACADAGAWTPQEARAWWRARETEAAAARAASGEGKGESTAFARTIAVDLRERRAAQLE